MSMTATQTRPPQPNGRPDVSCPSCGEPTEVLVGGAVCADRCGWHECWKGES